MASSSAADRVVALLDGQLVQGLGVGDAGRQAVEQVDVILGLAVLAGSPVGRPRCRPRGRAGPARPPARPAGAAGVEAQVVLASSSRRRERGQVRLEVAQRSPAAQRPWQNLNFLPLPHGHGSLRPDPLEGRVAHRPACSISRPRPPAAATGGGLRRRPPGRRPPPRRAPGRRPGPAACRWCPAPGSSGACTGRRPGRPRRRPAPARGPGPGRA